MQTRLITKQHILSYYNATVTNIIDRDTAYNSFLKLPSAGLRGSNGKNISRIGNGAYLWR
jgi:hypothetical protein